MTTSFHLDSQPWLPVTYTDGTTRNVSLRTLFADAPQITRLVPSSPPGQAALLRVLTALTYRLTGLDDASTGVEDWHQQRNEVLAAESFTTSRTDDYFDTWHSRFDLFDPHRPWRQDARLAIECTKRAGLNALLAERPAGNNPAFLSIFHDGAPGTADVTTAVQAMLTWQFYGPLGRCSSRALPGKTASANFTYCGPLRARVSYHPVAPTLFGSLLAHLVPPITLPFASPDIEDLAEWELPTPPEPDGVKPSPTGVVSLLANDSGHAVLLVPGADVTGSDAVIDAHITWRFANKAAGNLLGWDPYLSYREDPKKGRIAKMAKADRDMWRDLPALLAPPEGGQPRSAAGYGQPRVAAAFSGLSATFLKVLRTAAHGFEQHGFQPQNTDWFSALSPAVFESAASNPDDATAAQYRTAIPSWVAAAETEAEGLQRALRRALREGRNLDPNGDTQSAWSNAALPVYWERAFRLFDAALSQAADGAAFSATVPQAPARLREVALGVYDDVTAPVQDARGLRAVVRHRPSRAATTAGAPAHD